MITMYFEAGSLEVYPINASSTATFLARALMLTAPLAASCLVRFFFPDGLCLKPQLVLQVMGPDSNLKLPF